ncbi:MAG: 2-phosphosulfolactate phosphatase [Verrucomicrobiales bacterium]|nr:2-phosphosulfolactate phosphatase [Verrucomicrobiales bacterium]
MKVSILHLVEGARAASGAVVVIDVFRAFSLVPHAFMRGCERVVPVGDVEEAYGLKAAHPDWLVAGERFTKKLEGFDFGNSPSEIEAAGEEVLGGKTLIHTTHAGTQGLVNATGEGVEVVLTGSFVNAAATVGFIRAGGFGEVSLVCMGHQAERPTDEDTWCAEYLKGLLLGEPVKPREEIVGHLRGYESAEKFFDEEKPWTPERDFELCMDFDAADFAVVRKGGGLVKVTSDRVARG